MPAQDISPKWRKTHYLSLVSVINGCIGSGKRNPLSRQGQHCAGTRAAHVQLLSAKTLSAKPVPGEFWDSDFMSKREVMDSEATSVPPTFGCMGVQGAATIDG